MAYTADDLTAVQQAKMDLALGKRWSSQSIQGDNINLAEITMADLDRLELQISMSLTPPVRRTVAGNIRRR
jgi:hypothetical protein